MDHEGQGLLKDGIPFIMSGWFAGGYAHESAGLPPASLITNPGPVLDSEWLSALGQASLTTEWGRDGVTFVRAGGWSDPKTAGVYLDAAAKASATPGNTPSPPSARPLTVWRAQAGVSVLWNVGADRLARAMARIVEPAGASPWFRKTNTTQCGTVPTESAWTECVEQLTRWLKAK